MSLAATMERSLERELKHTSTATYRADTIFNLGILNALIDASSDMDLYESDEELHPSAKLLKIAANTLSGTPIEHAEIAPYLGEINVTWKKYGRRVKAIFGPSPNTFMIYREEMEEGKVIDKKLEANADPGKLHKSIEWLYGPAKHVR